MARPIGFETPLAGACDTDPLSASTVFEPSLEHWPDGGVYQIWIRVFVPLRLTVGRLGRFLFPADVYVYTGRASRRLRARVARHVRGAGRLHWHIDYLLAHRNARVDRVVLASHDPDAECTLNQAAGLNAVDVAPGFGASDCVRGCAAHLWRV